MFAIEPPARVEVDTHRRYITVSDSACELLGYTREELLGMTIDDITAPSGAHVPSMFERFVSDRAQAGIFALRHRNGQLIWIRYEASIVDGRAISVWTHYAPGKPDSGDPL